MADQQLRDIDRALLQILVASKVIDDEALEAHFASLKNDYPGQNVDISLSDTFKKLNVHLRRSFLMEIKSVVMGSGEQRKYFHSLVNTAEDFVATEFGSHITGQEMEFVRDLFNFLVEMKKAGAQEVRSLAQSISVPKASEVVETLLENVWLVKDAQGYFEIGPRSYLEIRQFLEAEAGKQENAEALPQVLYY